MSEPNVQPEDYVSSSQVRHFIAGIFRTTYKLLSVSKHVLIKNWVALLVGAAAGGLVGVIYYVGASSNYKVSMIVSYSELDKKALNDLLSQLQTLVVTQSQAELASTLGISERQASNIRSIEGQGFNNEMLTRDTASTKQIKILVGLRSPIETDSLQNAIVSYLNNLPYLKQIKQAKVKVYGDQLAFIDHEQGKLDTLQGALLQNARIERLPSTIYNNESDPASIYNQSLRLDSLRYITALLMATDTQFISLISGFKPTHKPIRYSRSVSIVGCMCIGICIAFIFLLFGEINKRLNGVV